MATELAGIRRAIRNPARRDVTMRVAGVGRAATIAGVSAVAAESPRAVIMVGFCGGADPGLRTGDIHVASAYHNTGAPASDVIPADPGLSSAIIAAARGRSGRMVAMEPSATVDAVAGPAVKSAVREAMGAASVNMEDYWAADAARAAGVPFASVRAVLDAAGDDLPPWVSENVARTAGRVVAHPRRVPGLVRVAGQAMIARRNLTRCVVALIDALASPQSSLSAVSR